MNWLDNVKEGGEESLQYLMESYYLIKAYQQKEDSEES